MTATRTQRKRRKLRARRCDASGKVMFATLSEAMLFLRRGEPGRYFYRCPSCGSLHITKKRRTA